MRIMFVGMALIAIVGAALISCDGSGKAHGMERPDNAGLNEGVCGVNRVDSFPWNFPKDFALNDVEEGQTVLSPATFYGSAIQRGDNLTTTLLPVYNFTVEKVGRNTITIASMGEQVVVPQALTVPLPKGETAQNGDVVLTWWQSGEGLQRAIVVDDTKLQKPKVCYLDLDYKSDGRGFANCHANEELHANSFKVLKNGEWTSGASVAIENNGQWKAAIILNVHANKVLLLDAESRIMVAEKSRCRLIPIEMNYDVGEHVFAKLGYTFEADCRITKVDKRVGRVWVEKNGTTVAVSILDVVRDLTDLAKK